MKRFSLIVLTLCWLYSWGLMMKEAYRSYSARKVFR